MKTIKSFDCRSTAKYGIAINTAILTLSFPFISMFYISILGMSSETITRLLIDYSLTFFTSGIIGGALTGFLFALGYNLFSPYFETASLIKCEFYEESEISESL
jgi:hypothetical protein